MTTTRGAAVAALAALLQQTGAQVWTETDLPRVIPPEGLIEVRDGEAQEQALLSPLRWEIDQHAEVIISVTADDEPTRDAALDALLKTIGTLIAADRSLGGAVDWTEPMSPQHSVCEIDGAGASARLIVTLSFFTDGTVLG